MSYNFDSTEFMQYKLFKYKPTFCFIFLNHVFIKRNGTASVLYAVLNRKPPVLLIALTGFNSLD